MERMIEANFLNDVVLFSQSRNNCRLESMAGKVYCICEDLTLLNAKTMAVEGVVRDDDVISMQVHEGKIKMVEKFVNFGSTL